MIVHRFQATRTVPGRPKECDVPPCPTVLVAIPLAKKGSEPRIFVSLQKCDLTPGVSNQRFSDQALMVILPASTPTWPTSVGICKYS